MKVVSVLLGAVAVAGVGSKPTFDKMVHLYFSNIYIYIYISRQDYFFQSLVFLNETKENRIYSVHVKRIIIKAS